MKKFLFVLIVFISAVTIAQTSEKLKSIEEFRRHINAEFKDPDESPLTKEDFKTFETLEFFPADTNYIVEAKFVRTPYESPFEMQTSTNRTPVYVKYGELYFSLKGKNLKLNVYQSQSLTVKEEYKDYLFLPFTDKSNGLTSYGGGRYIDLKIPEGSSVRLDFNKAYNPYCAYSGRYSCPVPPSENDLDIAIPVGVKKYHE